MLPECVPGGDLNGDLGGLPVAMGEHRTMVHSGTAMVLGDFLRCKRHSLTNRFYLLLDYRMNPSLKQFLL